MSLLGERFLQYRLTPQDEEEVTERALLNIGGECAMRSELRKVVSKFFNTIEIPKKKPDFKIPEEIAQKLKALVRIVIRARTGVIRDYSGLREITYIPDHEGPARLTKQLAMLMMGLAMLRGSTDITLEDYHIVYKTGLDCIHKIRHSVLRFIASQREQVKTADVATTLDLSTPTAGRYLEDLTAVSLLVRLKVGESDRSANLWALKPEVRGWWEETRP